MKYRSTAWMDLNVGSQEHLNRRRFVRFLVGSSFCLFLRWWSFFTLVSKFVAAKHFMRAEPCCFFVEKLCLHSWYSLVTPGFHTFWIWSLSFQILIMVHPKFLVENGMPKPCRHGLMTGEYFRWNPNSGQWRPSCWNPWWVRKASQAVVSKQRLLSPSSQWQRCCNNSSLLLHWICKAFGWFSKYWLSYCDLISKP